MTRKIVRLERDTIVEAIFELRFQGTASALGDLLPGLLFPAFKGRSPKALRTAISNLPREIQSADEMLRYMPRHGLVFDQFQILMGDLTVQLSNQRPYVGWSRFKPMIQEVLGHLQQSGLIASVERSSLKYINLIEEKAGLAEQFAHIELKAALNDRDLTTYLTSIRTEFHEEEMINIVEISPRTKVLLPEAKQEVEGIMVAVDTINTNAKDFWANQDMILERTHDMEKSVFFDMLTEGTVSALGPVYE